MNFSKLPLARKITWAFATAIIMVILIGALTVQNIRSLLDSSYTLEQSGQLVRALETALASVKAIEAAQEDYILTGDPQSLRPYYAGTQTISELTPRLIELTDHSPQQQERLAELIPALQRQAAISREVIEVRRTQGFAPALTMIRDRMPQGAGEEIRRLVNALQSQEDVALQGQSSEVSERGTIALGIIAVGNSIAVAVIALSAIAINRDLSRRESAADRMLRANYRLERLSGERMGELRRVNETLRSETRQRTHAEQERERLVRCYGSLLDALQEGVVIVDDNNVCTYINHRGAALLGYVPSDLLRKNIGSLVLDGHGNNDERGSGSLLADGKTEPEATRSIASNANFRRRDGTLLPVTYQSVRLPTTTHQDLAVIFNDLSSLRSLHRRVHVAESRAASAHLNNGQFLLSMALELRARLENAHLHTVLLEDELRPTTNVHLVTSYAHRIGTDISHTLDELDEISELASFEVGKLNLSWETFDILLTLRSVLQNIRPDLAKRSNQIAEAIPPADLLAMHGDLTKTRKCLRNLLLFVNRSLTNATLVCTVGSELQDTHPWITIALTGADIDLNDSTQLSMELPFVHAAQHGFAHQGFGLAIVQRHAQLMGGKLKLSDGPQHLFTLSLPMTLALPKPEPARPAATQPA